MTKRPLQEQDFPRPETLQAQLRSEGVWYITEHHYHSTELEILPGPYGGSAYVFYFKCTVSGVLRPYGNRYVDETQGSQGVN